MAPTCKITIIDSFTFQKKMSFSETSCPTLRVAKKCGENRFSCLHDDCEENKKQTNRVTREKKHISNPIYLSKPATQVQASLKFECHPTKCGPLFSNEKAPLFLTENNHPEEIQLAKSI